MKLKVLCLTWRTKVSPFHFTIKSVNFDRRKSQLEHFCKSSFLFVVSADVCPVQPAGNGENVLNFLIENVSLSLSLLDKPLIENLLNHSVPNRNRASSRTILQIPFERDKLRIIYVIFGKHNFTFELNLKQEIEPVTNRLFKGNEDVPKTNMKSASKPLDEATGLSVCVSSFALSLS